LCFPESGIVCHKSLNLLVGDVTNEIWGFHYVFFMPSFQLRRKSSLQLVFKLWRHIVLYF